MNTWRFTILLGVCGNSAVNSEKRFSDVNRYSFIAESHHEGREYDSQGRDGKAVVEGVNEHLWILIYWLIFRILDKWMQRSWSLKGTLIANTNTSVCEEPLDFGTEWPMVMLSLDHYQRFYVSFHYRCKKECSKIEKTLITGLKHKCSSTNTGLKSHWSIKTSRGGERMNTG